MSSAEKDGSLKLVSGRSEGENEARKKGGIGRLLMLALILLEVPSRKENI